MRPTPAKNGLGGTRTYNQRLKRQAAETLPDQLCGIGPETIAACGFREASRGQLTFHKSVHILTTIQNESASLI
jgi:hypothetical protein